MKTCPKCNASLPDEARFCGECGANLTEVAPAVEETPVVEPSPAVEETPVVEPAPAVEETPVVEPAPAVEETPVAEPAPAAEELTEPTVCVTEPVAEEPKKKKKNKKKLFIAIGAGALAFILIVSVLAIALGGGKKEEGLPERLFYLTSDGAFCSFDTRGKSTLQYEQEEETSYGSFSQLTANATRHFFLIAVDENYEGTLCYTKFGAKNEVVEITKHVSNFVAAKDGKSVLFEKNDHLYLSNLKEEERIAKDFRSLFYVDETLKTLLYTDTEGTLFLYKNGKTEELTEDVSDVLCVADNLSKIYFTVANEEDENGYRTYDLLVWEKKSTKTLVEDIDRAVIFDDGTYLYTETRTEEVNLLDYVTDEKKESDEAMTEPEYPDYPDYEYVWSFEYDSYEEYKAAYDAAQKRNEKLEEEYEAAKDAYWELSDEWYAKGDRDDAREHLDRVIPVTCTSLYYADGKNEVCLTEKGSSFSLISYDKKVVSFVERVEGSVEKKDVASLAESYSYYSYESDVKNALAGSGENHIAVAGTVCDMEEEYTSLRMAQESDVLYLLNEDGELFTAKVKKDTIAEPEQIDEDVDRLQLVDGHLVYYKEYDAERSLGELYLDGKFIADDVYTGMYLASDEYYYFYTDHEEDENVSTINRVKFGKDKAEKLVTDVRGGAHLMDGDVVAYLTDYEDGEGELKLFTGKKTIDVEEDVSRIFFSETLDFDAMNAPSTSLYSMRYNAYND